MRGGMEIRVDSEVETGAGNCFEWQVPGEVPHV
jgi:hypothetical protein